MYLKTRKQVLTQSVYVSLFLAVSFVVLSTSILILLGTGGLLAWLPFRGEEFGLLGVGLLLYANHMIVKKIQAPLVCPS